jgi:hypothetical protein
MQENFLQAAGSGATLVHRLDPRTKMALLLMSFVMAILPERPAVAGVVAGLVLGHLALARAWGELYRIRWLLAALLVFSLTVWSLLAHGPTPLFWRVSRESLAFGAATFLKFGTMMVAGLVLLATTRVEELFLGLVRLRLPYPVAFAFALALRWVPEVYQTALRVKEAQEETTPAPAGAYFSSDLAPHPDHVLGPGGPGLPGPPAAHLPPGNQDGPPGLAGSGPGRSPPHRLFRPAPGRLGPDSRSGDQIARG